MISRAETLHHRLLQRRCVACGFDDAPLEVPRFNHCPCCGCDFTERPPKSYAEMEGFIGQPLTLHNPDRFVYQQRRLFRRWIIFSVFSAALLITVVYLVTAVVKPF